MESVTGPTGPQEGSAQSEEQKLTEEFFKFFMESEMMDDVFEDIEE